MSDPLFKPGELFPKIERTLEVERSIMLERGAAYGDDGHIKHAAAMAGLFPEGVTVKTVEEWTRLLLFIYVTMKVSRYANNFATGGHEDSSLDGANYFTILHSFDQLMKERADKKIAAGGDGRADIFGRRRGELT